MVDLSNGHGTCVIGAGFSGLAAARALRAQSLPFVCFERANHVGGLWHYPDDGKAGAAYRSLHLNTSRKVTSYTGFAMPANYPRYPRHDQVFQYLDSFVDHFGLRADIQLGTEVVAVRQLADSTWDVTTRQQATGAERHQCFSHVVVASGHQWTPALPAPALSGADSFTGEQMHSFDYREPSRFAGKRVVVLGIGNSACDISVELSRTAEKTYLAMRRGTHVIPKQMMGIPIDEIASSRWWSWMPFRAQRRLIEILLQVIRGPITNYGMPRPDHRIFSAPVAISDELLTRTSHGDIIVKPMVDHLDGSSVHFTDGTVHEADTIIYCTGYRISFPFLPRKYVFSSSGQVALYKRVVAPHWPGLHFVGLIRPVGSITRLLESQAEWVADLIGGDVLLPSVDTMYAEVERHLASASARYGTSPADSILVDFAGYLRLVREERTAGLRRARGEPRASASGFVWPAYADLKS